MSPNEAADVKALHAVGTEGGDGLADIAVVRAEPAVFGLVASDPTVSQTIDTGVSCRLSTRR